MVLRFLVLAFLLVVASGAQADELPDTAAQWATAVAAADIPALEKMLADDYVHIHGTGLFEDKKKFIGALQDGSRKYDPIIFEEVTVRKFGATTIVTGKFKLKAVAKGKTIEGVNRATIVIVKGDAGDKVVSFHAALLPPPASN